MATRCFRRTGNSRLVRKRSAIGIQIEPKAWGLGIPYPSRNVPISSVSLACWVAVGTGSRDGKRANTD